MKKLGLVLVIAVMLLAIGNILYAESYTPLTKEQADNYLGSVSYDTIIEMVIDYDYLEHTVPTVVLPRTDYVLYNTDLTIHYAEGLQIKHGKLSYLLDIPDKVVYNFIEIQKTDIFTPVLTFVIGTGIGMFIMFIGGLF